MKKNEIRFISTENGINCEGNVALSQADRNKVEQMLQRVQDAAKDCGAALSLSPVGIQLGFEVALSCDTKCINEADARMKCIIEEMREFISKLETENKKDIPEDESIAEEQYKQIDEFFETMRSKYPNSRLTFICHDGDYTSIASNMHPGHILHLIAEANAREQK